MVIVDTTVLVDYLNDVTTPETEWLDTELGRQPLGLLDLMVCEVWPSYRHRARPGSIEQRLISRPGAPTPLDRADGNRGSRHC